VAKPSPTNPRGAGRKPGTENTSLAPLSRVRAMEIVNTGQAPLDIMLRNMLFWDETANALKEQIEFTMVAIQDAVASGDLQEDLLKKAKDLLSSHLSAREKAQGCAVDAAPYVHPRMMSIQMKKPGGKKIVVKASLGAAKAEEGVNRDYRVGYGTVIPLKHPVGK
jgi:hypothetical protein